MSSFYGSGEGGVSAIPITQTIPIRVFEEQEHNAS